MHTVFRSLVSWAGSLALLAGCATNSPLPSHTVPAPVAPAPVAVAPIDYGAAAAQHRQSLAQAGLLPAFESYWNTHAAKNWQQLFRMEHTKNLPSAEFYMAYHAKAWPVLAIEVVGVELQEQQATLTLHMRFQNPDKKGREHALYRKDQWTRTDDGRWLHVVTDPMLVGVHH